MTRSARWWPSGWSSCGTPDRTAATPPVGRILDLVVATQHPGHKPGDVIELGGPPQILWAVVTHVYLAGLATDYCVKYSAIDACGLGFRTFVILDGCRGVNLQPNDSAAAVEEMKAAGVEIVHSTECGAG